MRSEYKRLCASAASRETLARAIEAIARESGASVTRRPAYLSRARAVLLLVSKGAWRCMIDFEAQSSVGAFLGHWYHDGGGAETLPLHFGLTIRGSENPYHRRKATSCCDSFDAFCVSIRAGLMALGADGPAPGAENPGA